MYHLDEDQRGINVYQSIQKEENSCYQVLLLGYEFHKMCIGDKVTNNYSKSQNEDQHIKHLIFLESNKTHKHECLQTHAQESESASSK